jgi:hypothetical protein
MENITGIELSDSANSTMLTKTGKGWLVASFKANTPRIEILKRLLSTVEAAYPLPATCDSLYAADMATKYGIAVSLFKNSKVVKAYTVFLLDDNRVAGLIRGAKHGYILEFNSTQTNVADYFVAEQSFWESNILFALKPQQIKAIKVEHTADYAASFSIDRTDDTLRLFDAEHRRLDFDTDRIRQYLNYFGDVSFDVALDLSDSAKQSLAATVPAYRLTVVSASDSANFNFYAIPDTAADDYGKPLGYNRDFFILTSPCKKLYARAAWLEFDILLENAQYFRPHDKLSP